jgi:hypothetical protein
VSFELGRMNGCLIQDAHDPRLMTGSLLNNEATIAVISVTAEASDRRIKQGAKLIRCGSLSLFEHSVDACVVFRGNLHGGILQDLDL